MKLFIRDASLSMNRKQVQRIVESSAYVNAQNIGCTIESFKTHVEIYNAQEFGTTAANIGQMLSTCPG